MPESRVFLVGAGSSFVAPAFLPMFPQLRDALADWMKLPSSDNGAAKTNRVSLGQGISLDPSVSKPVGLSIIEKIEIMPPEVFMQCVRLGGVQLNAWLVDILSGGEPNAVHAVLAWALDHGASVWSLNVDELIESVPATVDESTEAARIRRSSLVAHRASERSGDPELPPTTSSSAVQTTWHAESAELHLPNGSSALPACTDLGSPSCR